MRFKLSNYPKSKCLKVQLSKNPTIQKPNYPKTQLSKNPSI